ncbi:hypothetical protein SeMB42_g00616 [Synchytrium endobioticum]|uniref:F-box domain-containing protein n=1 Tax=Synchytrium endobioticum TaxID=286115 RepID=A0A507DRC7_9FUNG|nr:hypothetical protein SeLEV6574_g04374 [Synchytrium endobioticum]TPX53805.1 hypothetical protein SeMB42_g00616 [Synchytrium endobioticum]
MSEVSLPVPLFVEVLRYLTNQQNSRKIQAYSSKFRHSHQQFPRPASDFEPHEKRIGALEERLRKSIERHPAVQRKPSTKPATLFAKLPEECLNHLFAYCKPKALVKLALTCVEMYRSVLPYLYSKPSIPSMSSLKSLITSLRLDAIMNSVKPYSVGDTLGVLIKVLDLDALSLKTPLTELLGLSDFIAEAAILMPNIRKFYLPNQISLSGRQAFDLVTKWNELVHFEAVISATTRTLVDHTSFHVLSTTLALSDPTARAANYIGAKVRSTYSLNLLQSSAISNVADLEAASVVKLIESSRKHLTKFALLAQRDLDGQVPPSALAALSIYIGAQLNSLVLSRPGTALDVQAVTSFAAGCPNLSMLVLGGGPQDILSDEVISAFSSLRRLRILYIRSFQLSRAEAVSELILNNRESLKVVYVVGSHQFLETRPSQVLAVPGLPFLKLEILALCGTRRHGLMLGDGELPDYASTLTSLCPKLFGVRLSPNPVEGAAAGNVNVAANNEQLADIDMIDDDDVVIGIGAVPGPQGTPPPAPIPPPVQPAAAPGDAFLQPLGQALAGLEQAVNQANHAALQAQNVVNQALGALNQAVPGINNNQQGNQPAANDPAPNGQQHANNNNANINNNNPNNNFFLFNGGRIPHLPRKIGNAYVMPTFYSSDVARWDDQRMFQIYKKHIKHTADQLKRRAAARQNINRQTPPDDDDSFPPFDGEDDEPKEKKRARRTPLPPHLLGPFPGGFGGGIGGGFGFLGLGGLINEQNAAVGNNANGANQQNQQGPQGLPQGLNNLLDGIFGGILAANNNANNGAGGNANIGIPLNNNNNNDDNEAGGIGSCREE